MIIETDPVEGPAQLVSVRDFIWTDDYSWLRHLTCRNHPTAKYYTKSISSRGLHLVTAPTPDGTFEPNWMGECPCPASDLVVVVAPGSQEERDMIASREYNAEPPFTTN